MAQNKVTIDVEARFIDNVTSAAKKADKAVSDLDKKKPKVTISADDKATPDLKDVEKEADKVGKKKPKVKVDADDQATSKLNKILEKTKALANKVYSASIKIRDSQALSALATIEQKTRTLAGKVFTATIKIKDMALAPLQKIHSKKTSQRRPIITEMTPPRILPSWNLRIAAIIPISRGKSHMATAIPNTNMIKSNIIFICCSSCCYYTFCLYYPCSLSPIIADAASHMQPTDAHSLFASLSE
jgi:vacuolar-type H+-ATPase subunit H